LSLKVNRLDGVCKVASQFPGFQAVWYGEPPADTTALVTAACSVLMAIFGGSTGLVLADSGR
jgi:hypothetical protein